MPYCRKCGTRLEENAEFCHKCGTQVVIFCPAPLAESASKSQVSTPVIVLTAVILAAVIVSIFVFLTLNPVNFNQANPTNQTNATKMSFNLQKGITQSNVLDPRPQVKADFNGVSARTALWNNRPSSYLKERNP